MAIFKCKMCGGNLEVTSDTSVVTCEYCGTYQTISKSRDEVVSNLYNRANDLRIKCEFDRAEQTYEKILEQDNTESEAHWGIVLCRYGIEYVEDPKTGKRIPTCHRTSYEAITSDADYLAAIENADQEQRTLYKAEVAEIDRIQKDILAIVKNEEPFDVFICYKETDKNGKRTVDSTIANDIYYQLTQEGFKVFYAPITLEDKLGQEYEPYIFAALNSAKVMLVVGTKPEYFNAVWVKNEWSRYLKLLKTDRSKMIIPCYRDMDAYDLPDEFAHLQSQDMSKIGFIQDLLRGIKKVVIFDSKRIDFESNTVMQNHNLTKKVKTLSPKQLGSDEKKGGKIFVNIMAFLMDIAIVILAYSSGIRAYGNIVCDVEIFRPLYGLGGSILMLWFVLLFGSAFLLLVFLFIPKKRTFPICQIAFSVISVVPYIACFVGAYDGLYPYGAGWTFEFSYGLTSLGFLSVVLSVVSVVICWTSWFWKTRTVRSR